MFQFKYSFSENLNLIQDNLIGLNTLRYDLIWKDIEFLFPNLILHLTFSKCSYLKFFKHFQIGFRLLKFNYFMLMKIQHYYKLKLFKHKQLLP